MSHSHRATSPFSRALRGVGHALAEDSRRHASTPMHEALAVGLGLVPASRPDDRDARR